MRIAVLGAGITGVATAEWLRRDGHEVTLIDRIMPGDPGQTSYGNAGILASQAVVPVSVPGLWKKAPKMLLDPDGPLFLKWRYLPRLLPWLIPFLRKGSRAEVERIAAALQPLVGDSVDQHRAIAAGTGAEKFFGDAEYMHLFPRKDDFEADTLGAFLRERAGFKISTRDRQELLERDPKLGPRYNFAIVQHETGFLRDPGGYVRALFDHYAREGGGFVRAEVQDVRSAEDGVTVTAGGAETAYDHAVVSMGAWSGDLVRRLGHNPGLESERGYHLILKNPSHVPPAPYMLSDLKFVATPMAMGLRLAGLVEFGGLDAPASKAPHDLQRRQVKKLYPDLEWEGEETWLGHRPSTIDSLPLVGECLKARRVWCAFGGQHLGLTMGPKVGRLIADQIGGRKPNINLAPYRVDRFGR